MLCEFLYDEGYMNFIKKYDSHAISETGFSHNVRYLRRGSQSRMRSVIFPLSKVERVLVFVNHPAKRFLTP